MIQIDFIKSDPTGAYTYSDALYLADDHSFTEEEIESMKQARFDKWLTFITTPLEHHIEEVAIEESVSTLDESVVL